MVCRAKHPIYIHTGSSWCDGKTNTCSLALTKSINEALYSNTEFPFSGEILYKETSTYRHTEGNKFALLSSIIE